MTRNQAARGISPSLPQPPMEAPHDAARSASPAAGSSRRAAELRPPRCHPRCAAAGPGKGLRSPGAEPQPQAGDAPWSPAPRGQPHLRQRNPSLTAPLRRRRRPPPPRVSPAHGGVIHAAPASLKTRSRTPAAPPPPAAQLRGSALPDSGGGGAGGPAALRPPPRHPPAAEPRAPSAAAEHRATFRSDPICSVPLRSPPPPAAAPPAPPPFPALNPSSASALRCAAPGRKTSGPVGALEPARCSGRGAAPTRSPKGCPPLGRMRLPEHQHARVGEVELRAASPAPRFLGLSLPSAPGGGERRLLVSVSKPELGTRSAPRVGRVKDAELRSSLSPSAEWTHVGNSVFPRGRISSSSLCCMCCAESLKPLPSPLCAARGGQSPSTAEPSWQQESYGHHSSGGIPPCAPMLCCTATDHLGTAWNPEVAARPGARQVPHVHPPVLGTMLQCSAC